MRKAAILTFFLTIAFAIPTFAIDQHQSFISYDDGGTVIKQGDDGREVESRVNLPVYPGDEVVTSRRGRAEVHLSDGNTLGIDRATAVRLRSILDSYEGEDDQTVVELRFGKVALHRTDIGRDVVRLDTQNASYVAGQEGIYSVESDADGRDRIAVFEGSLEIRTPSRTTRIRAGESATVDDRGVYDLISDSRNGADDFERWFLRRAERYGNSNRYIGDRRLSYWADDLDSHGRWVMVSGIGWSWRPYVSAGWRPYYHGYWSHRYGSLTWISYDPWGWVPYHYGRWAYDPGYGWVWVPGFGYSPAWVYWWYGDSYVGWAPAGWWDCHRSYYNWAYRPYNRIGHFGFGFHGRVRIGEMDLRPWTFVDGNTLVSNRIDRAALTTDAIKQRLGRSRDGLATISGSPARFTREEVRDPAEAIRRRGIDGRGLGRETGAPPTDVTPFFRRDPEVGASVRDRIVRGRGGDTTVVGGAVPSRGTGSAAPSTGGGLAPIGRGNVAPIGGGNVAPITGGSVAPIGRGNTDAPAASDTPSRPRVITIPDRSRDGETPSSNDNSNSGSSWRDRVRTPREDTPAATAPPASSAPSGSIDRSTRGSDDSWRRRPSTGSGSTGSGSSGSTSSGSSSRESGSTTRGDVPRRVIDRIVVPRDNDNDSGSTRRESTRDSSRDSSRSRDSGSSSRSSGSSTRDSGSSSRSSGSSTRDSGGSRDSGKSSGSRDSGGSKSSGSRESGGRIKRN